MNKKAISSAAAAIFLATISITLVGTTYFFSSTVTEKAMAETFEVIDVYNNRLIVRNTGTQPIEKLKTLVDGKEVSNLMDTIQPKTVGTVSISLDDITEGTHELIVISESISQTLMWEVEIVEETTTTITTEEALPAISTIPSVEIAPGIETHTEITQGEAEIDKPVKWTGKIVLKNPSSSDIEDYTLDLTVPEDAEEITIKDSKKRVLFKDKKSWKVNIPKNAKVSYSFEYETPIPYKEESIIEPFISGKVYKKRITVKSDFSGHYEDVKAYTDIPEELSQEEYLIRLYQTKGKSRIDITDFPQYKVSFIDNDFDNLFDKIEWVVPALSKQTFEISGYPYGITFDRDLICHKCGKHKAPPLTEVNVTISASVTNPVENDILTDYYPNDWLVINANEGVVSVYNSTYNKIEWNVGSITDSVSKWYLIRSPQRTIPPTKYYFQSELAEQKSDWWFVIVSDPVESIVPCSTCCDTLGSPTGSCDDLAADDGVNTFSVECKGLECYINTTHSGSIPSGITITDVDICWDVVQLATNNNELKIKNAGGDGSWLNSCKIPHTDITTGWNCIDVGPETGAQYDCDDIDTVTEANNVYGSAWGYDDGGAASYIELDMVYVQVIYDKIPKYSDVGVNNTLPKPSEWVKHYVKWTDESLSGYIFWSNYTNPPDGQNETWESMTGTENWSNVTKQMPSTSEYYAWRIYANDSANNWNDTGIQSITVSNIWLEVDWDSGSEINSTTCTASQPCEFNQNSIFTANSTITCKSDLSGLSCGSVSGSVRYNESGTEPNQMINMTEGATSFYIAREWEDWNYPEWNYRKSHDITGSTAGNQTNYVMSITVINSTGSDSGATIYMDNKARSDFGDVRFTWYNLTSGEEQECDYWMEESYTGNNATFWVEIPEISNVTNNKIYIYYGNSTVTTTSNGANTFVLFSDNGVIGWTIDSRTWDTIDVGGDYGNVLRSPVPDSSSVGECHKDFSPTLNKFELKYDVYMRVEKYGTWVHDHRVVVQADTNNYAREYYLDQAASGTTVVEPNASITGVEGGITEVYVNDVHSYSSQTWYTMTMRVDGSNFELLEDDETVWSESWDQSISFSQVRLWSRRVRSYYDNFRLRKYVSPEPSHGSWGSEETPKNTKSCGVMNDNDQYQLNWTINTTGNINDVYVIDVNFSSNPTNDTENAYVKITEAGVEPYLTDCSVLNQAGATYYLTEDIIETEAAICMSITAENVTLDCQGFTIDGIDNTDNYGIYSDQFNTTIKNCNLTDWGPGILFDSGSNKGDIKNVISNSNSNGISLSSSNNTLTNITANNNTDYGILSMGTSNNTLINITANNNTLYGIHFWASSNNTLTNITTNFNERGIYFLLASNNNQLTNITTNFNTYGIYFNTPDNNQLTNIIADSNEYGIYLKSSDENTIKNSKIQNSTNYGIHLDSSGSNKIYNNLFNNTNNVYYTEPVYQNYWNTTRQVGERIYSSGTQIGGNYWTNSTGNGHSDTCEDTNKDGFCDDIYVVIPGEIGRNTDYLPLSDKYVEIPPYCDEIISSLPKIISENNTYYCVSEDLYIGGENAIEFLLNSSGVQNSTLDCLGYNLDGSGPSYGVYLNGSNTKNNTVKNCNITNFYNGIFLDKGPKNNTIINNTIISNNAYGIELYSSDYNTITNNTIKLNGNCGIKLSYSHSNKVINNILKSNWRGICLYHSGADNLISGGTIDSNTKYDIDLMVDAQDKFRDINFTGTRKIFFYDYYNKFYYNNATTGGIWLKTSLDDWGAYYPDLLIKRKITSWNQTLMQWNDTYISGNLKLVKYEITDLKPNTWYGIYENSTARYALKTSSTGELNFTINLSSEHEIRVEELSIPEYCDVPILDFGSTYTIDQNNTYYCVLEDIDSPGRDAIEFNNPTQNSTLDCLGYNLDSNDTESTYGVYLTRSNTKNNTIKNCYITDFHRGIYLKSEPSYNKILNNTIESVSHGGSPTFGAGSGIGLYNSDYNTIANNTVINNVKVVGMYFVYGILLGTGGSSNNNIITNNIINSNDYGIGLESQSSGNTLLNNTIRFNEEGIRLWTEQYASNTIIGGSINDNTDKDIYLYLASDDHYFRATNFTVPIKIYFADTDTWFNYNNVTTGEIWLKTLVNTELIKITRELINWDQTLMQWNDTASEAVTARYNISGLNPNKYYLIYNDSYVYYIYKTNSLGELPSFTIYLPDTNQHQITVQQDEIPPQYMDNSTNNTIGNYSTEFRLRWTDNVGLDSYVFYLDNCTGDFVKMKESKFPNGGYQDWSREAYKISDDFGCTIRWRYEANDTNNNWNQSLNYSFKVKFAYIAVNLTIPEPVICNETNPCEKEQNKTFNVSASVKCELTPLGFSSCGEIHGSLRYNESDKPDTLISITEGDEPFYIVREPIGELQYYRPVGYTEYTSGSGTTTDNPEYGYDNDYGDTSSWASVDIDMYKGIGEAEIVYIYDLDDINGDVTLNVTTSGPDGGIAAEVYVRDWIENDWDWFCDVDNDGNTYSNSSTLYPKYINSTGGVKVRLYIVGASEGEMMMGSIHDNFITFQETPAENPQSCGYLMLGETCQLNWTVNTTGDPGQIRVIDVNFSSVEYDAENVTDPAYLKIVERIPPQWSENKTFPPSGVNYQPNQEYQFNITWKDNTAIDDVIFEWNQAINYSFKKNEVEREGDEFYITLNDLPPNESGYKYRWYANDSFDNWNSTSLLMYIINKATVDIDLYLNNTQGYFPMYKDEYLNTTAVLLTPQSGFVEIWTNYSSGWYVWTDGDSPIERIEQMNEVGIWNFTANFTNANYTPTYDSGIVEVMKWGVLIIDSIEIRPAPGLEGKIWPIEGRNLTMNVTVNVTNTTIIDKCIVRIFNATDSYSSPSKGPYEGMINISDSQIYCFRNWDMEYWRNNGTWNVSVFMNLTSSVSNFTSKNFTYGGVGATYVNVSTINFTGIPGQEVESFNAYPLEIHSIGNLPVEVRISGTDFVGETNPSYVVGVENATYSETKTGEFDKLTENLVYVYDLYPDERKYLYFKARLPLGFISQNYNNIIDIAHKNL